MVTKHEVPILYDRNGSIYLRWYQNGRLFRRSLGKLGPDEAEALRAAKEAELKFGIKILSDTSTLRSYVETHYLPRITAGHKGKRNTAKFSLAPVLEKFGSRPLNGVEIIEARNFITQRLKQVRSATVNKEVRMWKAALNAAVDDKQITVNPLARLKAPKVITSTKAIVFYDAEQLATLYSTSGERRWLWQFLVNTGLRRGEMVKAERKDIVLVGQQAIMTVTSSEGDEEDAVSQRTKSARTRTIPLNQAATEALKHLGEGRLVELTAAGLSKAWEAARASANLEGGVHRLRHTFISHLVMKGVDLRTVQALAGHSNITITERYAHLAPGATLDAVSRIAL